MSTNLSPQFSSSARNHQPTRRWAHAGIVLGLIAACGWHGVAQAADLVWTNASGGNWTATANWSPNQVPGTNDTAWITNNGTYTVTFDTTTALAGLRLGGTSGTQTLSQANFTLTLNGPGSGSARGVYSFSGGILTGSGSLTLAGPFNWSGGTLGSAGAGLMVLANGGLAINGSTRGFNGGTLVNGGTGTWSAGQVNCNNGAVFSNAPAATFDLQADGTAFVYGNGSSFLANAGTLRKTAGAGTSTLTLPCSNSGAVQVNSGTLALTLANGSGSFTASANSTLSVNGTATLSGSASLGGPGNFTVTLGAITNNGSFSVQGTNTFSGGTAVLNGPCLVTNGTIVVAVGTTVFSGSGTVAPMALNLVSGSLLGSMNLAVAGATTWTGGSLGNAGSTLVVAANGTLAIGGSTKYFNGGTLLNGGAGAWTSGQINCNNAAVFSNAPAATFDVQADGSVLVVSTGSPVLANAGTFRKTGGTGTSTLTLPCSNSGSVQVNSGTLALTLADGSGSFTAAGNSTLSVSGTATLSGGASIDGLGNFTVAIGTITNNGAFRVQGTNAFLGGTAAFNGPCLVTNGTVVVDGAKVVFSGSGTLAPAALELSSGSLLGSMRMSVSGPFTWTSGIFGSAGSSLVVVANGSLALGGTTKTFNGGTLVNGSAGLWTVGSINCNSSAVFSNAPSATFDVQGDGTSFVLSTGTPLLANAGTFRKTAGTGTGTISVPCSNSGSVQVNSGTLALALANGSGNFTAASASTLSVSGTATLSASASLEGPGNFTVTGGALTNHGAFRVQGTNTLSSGTAVFDGLCLITNGALVVNGSVAVFSGTGTLAPASLILASGSLLGSMAVNVSGPFSWTGGIVGSAGSSLVIAANGGLALSGSTKFLRGGTVVNAGAGTWSAGSVNCEGAAIFSNAPAGTLDLQADGNAIVLSTGTPQMFNAGTLRKTAGAGTSTISFACNNSGTVQANTGTLGFGGAFIQNGGQTVLNGGNLAFAQIAQLRGGTLAGAGTVTGSVSNNATVSPGASPGLLTISGNYTEGPSSHLKIELGGTAAGAGYDQLSVGGTAKLAGALDVSYWNGFTPSLGNVFTVLVATARSGGFSTLTAPTNTLGTIYTAKTVLVEPGNASPTAQLTADPTPVACRTFVVRGAAVDPDGTVTNLTLLLDTNVLVSVAGATAQVTVSSDFPGDLTFTALATDSKGAQGATNVTVSITPLALRVLDPIGFQTNRAFKLCMAGQPGTNYQLQASDNLSATNWTALGTMENTNGIWRYSDTTATNSNHRYYRARQLP